MGREVVTNQLSFFGRFADELTRKVVPPGEFEVSASAPNSSVLYKHDGYFAIADLAPEDSDYKFTAKGRYYQQRTFIKNLTPEGAVELTFGGEDELNVLVTGVNNSTQKQVTFKTIGFLPPIADKAPVVSSGGATTELEGSIEGENVSFAVLKDVTGITGQTLLRIKRSSRMLMKPGPNYPFPPDLPLSRFKITEDGDDEVSIEGAELKITHVNGKPVAPTSVSGVDLVTVELENPTEKHVLGPDHAITTVTDQRGEAVFYFPSFERVSKLNVTITKDGYQDLTKENLAVEQGMRTRHKLSLTRT